MGHVDLLWSQGHAFVVHVLDHAGIVVRVRVLVYLVDEMLGVDVGAPDAFNDEVGTSDIVLGRCCPQKGFQLIQGNWDTLMR